MSRLSERLLPLPIAVFLALFFSIVVFLFIGIGWYMLERMGEVKQVVAQSNQLAADAEMEQAVGRVLQAVRLSSEVVRQWEEANQQISDPTYYGYWLDNRALQAGNLPSFVEALELYDSEGNILNREIEKISLPVQLPEQSFYLQSDHGMAMIYHFAPIHMASDSSKILGYSGIRVNFLNALFELNKFNYADTTSLSVLLFESDRLAPEEIFDSLSYQPHGLVETSALEQVMRESLIHFSLLALMMTIFGYVLVSKLLHSPLRCLTRYIDDLRNSNQLTLELKESGPLCLLELELLRDSLTDYQRQLFEMHNRLDQKNTELWEMAHHDPLTGISNRRAYDDEWRQLVNLVRGQRMGIAVLLIDCDHFKAINDTYGHAIGDEVLTSIASALRQAVREGDRLYRLGGDEFAIHMLNSDAESAQKLAVRCLESLAATDFKQLGIHEPVRFSIGIAVANGTQPEQLSNLHHNADVAMYQAKRPGHGKIVLHDQAKGEEVSELLFSNRIINAIYVALEQPETIELVYQPIFSLQISHKGVFELLIRLRDRENELIMPDNLLPVVVAEQLEAEFDFAVFNRVKQAFDTGEIPEGTPIAINICAASLLHPQLFSHLNQLQDYLKHYNITIELTEQALIRDHNETNRQLEQLRKLGFRLALDNFGSGYSSLRRLSSMQVDLVKFDLSMVQDLQLEGGQRQITETTARMIREAGYLMVAEGVESELVLKRVRKCGFTHAQGYLLGHPLSSLDAQLDLQQYALPQPTAESTAQ